MKRKILLYGPVIADLAGAYGGGTGGYTRKMGLYLHYFRSDRFEMIPCYHTVAGQYRYGWFVVRFLVDVWRFFRAALSVRPDIVHILAQYRRATPREFAVVCLARLLGIPVVYEIKAGVFAEWYQQTNRILRAMVNFNIRKSAVVLCQGMPYVELIRDRIGREAHYFPNFVPVEEIPDSVPEKLSSTALHVLFVGYAFRAKGVYELVEGCKLVSGMVPVRLTLIGKEEETFAAWLDDFETGASLEIQRLGKQPHDKVLEAYGRHDIYAYPTRHRGEGHNNSINEAMMMGLIIMTTRQGFMESILGPDRAFFLETVTPACIAETLRSIETDRSAARQAGQRGRRYLLEHFTSKIAFEKLQVLYERALV